MTIKVGSVFSGIGAFEQALKRLDYNHKVAFACDNGNINLDLDFDLELMNVRKLNSSKEKNDYVKAIYKESSRKTNFVELSYKANYQIDEEIFFYDIKLFDGYDFRKKIDLYVGGSPCQSFSPIGGKAGLEDTRGTLFYDYVRVLEEVKPEVFIYENVYGLYRHDKGKTWRVIQDVFENLGYHFKFEVLDSRDYGIPQGRRRIFVVGFKEKIKAERFNFPSKKQLQLTMQDLLVDNASEGSVIGKDGVLKIIKSNGDEVDDKYYLSEKLLKYCLSPGTKNFMHKDAKIDLPIARALLSTMGNHHRSSVNNYVTTNGRVRMLTTREVHRLMGFTDDYKIVVSKAQAYKQAGNSIVVDVLVDLIREINKVMGWKNEKN